MIMKAKLTMLFACIALLFQTLSAVNFSEVGDFRIVRKGSSLLLCDGKRRLGDIAVRKGFEGDISLLKMTVENGELVLDGSELFRQTPKAELVMRLNVGAPAGTNCNNVLTVEMRSDVPGTEAAFSLCGNPKKGVKGGKRWAAPRAQALLAETREFTYTRFLPPETASGNALFYLKPFGKIFIRSIKVSLPAESKTEVKDPTKNLMINGGAERGFYMTVPTFLSDLAQPNTGGAYHGKFGVWRRGSIYSIDDKNARTGKHCFKIRSFEASLMDRLTFAPVPVVVGKPLSFSAWMRADKKIKVQLWFANASGSRYARTFTVGTKWKKYTLTVSSFGAKQKGTSGNPGSTAGYNLIFPAVLVMGEGTVYLDDLRCQHSKTTSDEGETVPFRVTGNLDREARYYFAGEPMKADMTVDCDQPGSGTIGWKLYDFFGNVIAEGKPEKAAFPLKRRFEIAVPSDKRGAMQLEFTVVPNGGAPITHGFYCGVIDRAERLDPRFGLNLNHLHEPGKLISMMKDFGIGSIRIWRDALFDLPQSDPAAMFHDAGIFVFYSFARAVHPQRFMLPKDPTAYLANLERWITTVTKGKVDVYDLLNEPNAWHAKNPDPSKYLDASVEEVVKLERLMAEVIRRCDPGVPIAAPSVCNTRINYMDSFLQLGGAEFTDILTEHPYREHAELPDYYTDIQTIKNFSKKYNKRFRLFSTERGFRRPLFNQHGKFTERERRSTVGLVRIMLTALAGGMEQFYSFHSLEFRPGLDFNDTSITGDSGKVTLLPGPTFYTMRAAMTALRDAEPVRQIPMGFEQRCFLFRRKDGSSCAMLWKWHGDPAKIAFDRTMTGYDMMGSRIRGSEFILTPAPIYLCSAGSAEELAKLIEGAKLEVSGEAASATLVPTGKNTFAIRVANLSAKPLSGRVELAPDCVEGANVQTFSDLPPQKEVLLSFTSKQPLSLKKRTVKGRILPNIGKPVEFSLEFSGLLCPRTPNKLTIDGDLSDWPSDAAEFTLDSTRAGAGKTRTWEQTPEEKKLRAKVRVCWDAEHLYFAVTVNRELQSLPTVSSPKDMWRSDSLQIAFDPLMNAVKPRLGYNDDDFEYTISRFKGKPTVWRDYASASIYDSLEKKLGEIGEVSVSIRSEKGQTVYEMAFPTFSVSPFKLQAGSSMRFNILVNFCDGKVRRGYLELAPGIGGIKSPFDFVNITLIE